MTITQAETLSKNYVYRGKHFVICYFPQIKKYGAISHDHIDENGKLKIALNGLNMYLNDYLEDTIQAINFCIDIDFYMNVLGMSHLQALAKAYNFNYDPKNEEEFNIIFNK